jgi:small subunit ribosomal protein S21
MKRPHKIQNSRIGILAGFGGVFRVAEVKLQEGETLENALRFKRNVQREDIVKDVKRHTPFT